MECRPDARTSPRVNILINDSARSVRSGLASSPGPGTRNGPIPKPDTPFTSPFRPRYSRLVWSLSLSLYSFLFSSSSDQRSSGASFSCLYAWSCLRSNANTFSTDEVFRGESRGRTQMDPGKEAARCSGGKTGRRSTDRG